MHQPENDPREWTTADSTNSTSPAHRQNSTDICGRLRDGGWCATNRLQPVTAGAHGCPQGPGRPPFTGKRESVALCTAPGPCEREGKGLKVPESEVLESPETPGENGKDGKVGKDEGNWGEMGGNGGEIGGDGGGGERSHHKITRSRTEWK